MRLFFTILSIAYIAGIFLFADSSVVSTLSSFNPYSLLHIPLYGILTFLLIFSFVPLKFNPINPSNPTNLINQFNPSNLSCEMRSLFHWDPTNQKNQRNQRNFYLIPGGIALVVAIADEIYQAYVPGRDASITDVLLDLVGIILVLFFAFRLFETKTSITH